MQREEVIGAFFLFRCSGLTICLDLSRVFSLSFLFILLFELDWNWLSSFEDLSTIVWIYTC